MKIYQLIILSLILPYAQAFSEESIWDKKMPPLNYDKTSVSNIIGDIENLSRKLDPNKEGIHIITTPSPWESSDTIVTMHVTNASLKEAVSYLLEGCGMPFAVGQKDAYAFGWNVSGEAVYRRTGLRGRIIDIDTGAPISDARLTTDYRGSNTVYVDSNGTFSAVIDYYVRRPFGDGFSVYRDEDDCYRVDVSSQTHQSTNIQINCGDGHAEDIVIQMKKR